MTREQKVTELANYFAGQGMAVDLDYILATQAAFSDAALDIALCRIADISAIDASMRGKISGITNCILGNQKLSTEQLADMQQRIQSRA